MTPDIHTAEIAGASRRRTGDAGSAPAAGATRDLSRVGETVVRLARLAAAVHLAEAAKVRAEDRG